MDTEHGNGTPVIQEDDAVFAHLSPALPHRNGNIHPTTFWGPLPCEAPRRHSVSALNENQVRSPK